MARKPKAPAATPPVATTAASGVVVRTASDQLPLHSPLGASSAERWLNCPGSTALVAALGPTDDQDDPDYRRDGILAHELASTCLKNGTDCWEETDAFPTIAPDHMAAVQTYLQYVRGLPPDDGQHYIEQRVHLPEFHPQFYGTVDFALVQRTKGVHIVDYKHGEGVVVEVEDNPQLKYYAFGFIEADGADIHPDDEAVTLTIVQPRVPWHPDGIIRSWNTTAGELRKWAYDTLRPAMVNAYSYGEMPHIDGLDKFQIGEWCRFCPAKLLCPAMREAADITTDPVRADDIRTDPDTLDEKEMAWYLGVWPAAKMFYKALEERADRLLLAGTAGPELKAVRKVVNKLAFRVWNETAEVAVAAKLGEAAYTKPALISPAEAEKLPGGKDLVREYAFKPDNGLTGAPIDDRRQAVDVKPMAPMEERYGIDTPKELW